MSSILIAIIFSLIFIKVKAQIDLDNFRNASQLIESRGFKSETHTVTTRDGYLLTVFRVINPFANRTNERPVIQWHGLLQNADSWLISNEGVLGRDGVYREGTLANDCKNSITASLALTLATCGYDVWLASSRGTEYSENNMVYNNTLGSRFWEYTFTELGVYDVRAVVDYVRQVTNQDYVGYIGHSMGSTSMFILLSLDPEFETYVRPFIALAPFVYMTHMTSILRLVSNYEPILRSSARPLGIPSSIAQFVGIFICGNEYFNKLCADLLFFEFFGYDRNNFNNTRIPIFVSHTGLTYSTWIYAQIGQLIQSGTFSGFNYGQERNMLVYGQANPPDYPLDRIRSKNIAIFYGENDRVANITDVRRLIRQLQVPLLDNYLVPQHEWNHQDFTFGINQGYYINSRILRLLRLY